MAYPGSFFKDWLAEQAAEAKRQLADQAAQLAGVGEAGLTIGTGLAADVVGGVNASLAALAGRPDPGQHVEAARDAFTYTPRTDYGRQYMGEIGSGIQRVGESLAELPGADSVREGWYGVTTKAPMIAAVGSGIAQTFAPGGRVAGKADDVARSAERVRVYHGTQRAFDEFSKSGVNPNFTSPQKHLGYFFTDNPDYASVYAMRAGGEGGNVRPAELELKNPKRLPISMLNEIEDSWKHGQAKKFVAELKEAGHDGIIFEGETKNFGVVREYVAFDPSQVSPAFGAGRSDASRAASRAETVALRATDFAPTDADAFRAAINDARAKMPKTDAAQVSPLPDNFVGKTFLAPDGKSGFAVDQGGELIALFRHPDAEYRGVMDAALARGRAEGATHLNAFDIPGKLAEGYGKRGAVERERAAWNDEFAPDNWPYAELGKPDYVTMDLGPKQTQKAYKLFRTRADSPGQLFPLFVNADQPVPMGEWVRAQAGPPHASGKGVKSKIGQLAYRPGWHAGELPQARHIGTNRTDGKPTTRPDDQVWAEVEMANDYPWQEIADSRARIKKDGNPDPKTAHITDAVPYAGSYRYKTNSNMEGDWIIGGDMRVNRILSDDEVAQLNAAAGREDLPRAQPFDYQRYGFEPPPAAEPVREAAKGPISPDLLKNLGDEDSMRVFTHSNLADDPGRVREIKRYQPPRGAPAYAQRLAKNEDAYNQLLEWARQGMDEDGIGWYNTEEMRQAFVRELGDKEGNSAYELYIDLVAATSAGAKTPANAKIAGRYYHLARRGEPIVQAPKGSGYGHKAQNLHLASAQEIISGKGGLLEIENPKRYTFAENLKGNWKYVTVDKHNVRALAIASKDPEMMLTKLADGKPRKDKITGKAKAPPGPPEWWDAKVHGKWDPATFNPREWIKKNRNKVEWDQLPPTWFKEAPTKTDYAMLESITMRLAEDLGVTPAQAQAALWLGAGSRTGLGSPPKAFAKIFEDRIKATAKRDGITPKQALSDVIHARRMLGRADPKLLAGVGGGGLLAAWAMSGKDTEKKAVEAEKKRRNRTADLLKEMGE